MFVNLHVKNLALIEKAEVEFEEGLNILTGETGAGKSIIIGSINLALGAKASKDIIRKGADYAYIELLFSVMDEQKLEALHALDVHPAEDGQLIISKKIMSNRTVSKINDETVTAAKLRQITGLLIDVHGQHEHQSLLYRSKHLEILDEFAKSQINPIKIKTAEAYSEYTRLKKQLSGFLMDEESRLREADFYRYEIDEIEQANLQPQEEEELTAKYRRMSHSRKIAENVSSVHEAIGYDSPSAAGELIGRALGELNEAVEFDESLQSVRDQLYDVDAILNDINREIGGYLDTLVFDEEEFRETEERLDRIHNLQAKYGSTYERIMEKLEEKKAELERLEQYDARKKQTAKELKKAGEVLEDLCGSLSALRQEAAKELADRIVTALRDLNFLDVQFTIAFSRLSDYTQAGYDEVEYLISTNPGEPVQPLSMVASGGELSRIMLAIKAVLADTDDIPTLIFDEIDTGISGRTAQMVSEKLNTIAKSHQVICITHLPQIAAMADTHFEIEKSVQDGKTTTRIHKLNHDQMVAELARLLGGAAITDRTFDSAKEMKDLADRSKN